MFHKLAIALCCFFLSFCAPKYLKNSVPEQNPCKYEVQEDSQSVTEKLGFPSGLMKTNTGIYSLENGGENFIIRNWLFENTQKTIDIQYYMFLGDRTGLISADYLVRAADRGIKIRIIMDDATAKKGSYEIYALDSHENIEIKVYNPGVKLGSLRMRIKKLVTKPWRFHRRMHNKTITFDGQVTITGGRNIADEYCDYDHRYNFRDRDVLLAGKEVNSVTASFEEFWNNDLSIAYKDLVRKKKKKYDPKRFNRLHAFACDENNFSAAMKNKVKSVPATFKEIEKSGELVWVNSVSFVSDTPGKNENRKNHEGGICTDSLLALIKQAKTSIDIQSSYLIVTEEGKQLLKELTGRGVKIRILTNSLGSTDNNEAFNGYQRDRDEILKTGIDIYEFKPNAEVRYKLMIPEVQSALSYTPVYGHHAKTMVIDGHITVIGSFNVDPRSVNLNTECVVIVRSGDFANIILKHLNEETLPANAWHITKDFNPDKEFGTFKRVKAGARRVFPKKIL